MNNDLRIGAVILGAGLSTRMGKPKLLLPWGQSTVIGTIIDSLKTAGMQTIVLVSGASHQLLVDQLKQESITISFNPLFENENMLDSLRIGLDVLRESGLNSCLLVLGDQPQIKPDVIKKVINTAAEFPENLIIPSFQMRRGHPWVIPARYWAELKSMPDSQIMRDFINSKQNEIRYVDIDSSSILADMDTPEDYEREKPKDTGKQV